MKIKQSKFIREADMRTLIIPLILLVVLSIHAQELSHLSSLVHTYSIVARDPDTGEMGVAVQSHWFSVGSTVTWAEAGIGAIATQSLVNPAFGPEGLKLLREGKSASEAVRILIEGDEGRDYRQLAIIDAQGNVAAWTGPKCIAAAGHICGNNYSVQANMMLNDHVWPAMDKAFKTAKGKLAERMMLALEAAQQAGGDIRGKQSAAMLIVKGKPTGKVWEDRAIDLRVEDHPEPLVELRRLLQVDAAYKHMNAGDLAIEKNEVETALREYGLAEKLFPDNLEMQYWHAVSMANIGRMDESLAIFREIFYRDSNWRTLTKRIYDVGLLNLEPKQLQRIIKVK
jgi:uncharacterized Ntn-hydrolase superfamily protein